MLQSYEPKKYMIITKDLLLTFANEQKSHNSHRRNISTFEKIEEICLEYQNILEIDCLWPLTNLVKLKLNNNAIEKIENLENLKNLYELDLSFNHIKVIENLENLTNVHILSLYNNKIEIIEGINNMQNLTIFNIGKNKITNWHHVLYLRNLKELRSLQMVGNPCTEQNGYTSYLIAFVPQLVYYSYKMITKNDRAVANKKYEEAIASVLEIEYKKKKFGALKNIENKPVELSTSYVEYLNEDYLFNLMFNKDEDGRNFAKFNQDTTIVFEQYKQNFSNLCHQLYDMVLKEETRRSWEIEALNKVIEDKLINAIKKADQIMESVRGKRIEVSVRITQLLREVAVAVDDSNLDDDAIDEIDKVARLLSQEFYDYIQIVWKKLMYDETLIHQQIEEISRAFEINLNDLVTAFLESTQDYFSQLRSLEIEYSENILPIISYFISNLEEENKTSFIIDLIEEKDTLSNRLTTSHFTHIQVIDDRQDTILKTLKEWQTTFVRNLIEDETLRNRHQIIEITHFLEFYQRNTTVSMLICQQLQSVEDQDKDISGGNEGTQNFEENNIIF